MKPITQSDIDRLRQQIQRVNGAVPAAQAAPVAEAVAGAQVDGAKGVDTCGASGRFTDSGDGELLAVPSEDPYDPFSPDPDHYDAEQVFDGEVIENSHGRYFVTEKFYPGHARHGSFDISELGEMPAELVKGVSRNEIPPHDPKRWVFLDTETTGLAGGTGTCAFLVGVGTIEDGGFRVRLFFMRDYDEERAMLAGLAKFLSNYEVLVTYNGKAYDAPLLETRYRLARERFPLERLHHLDLLHGARQLWKLRMESCRLVELESEILGVIREGDLPGELIPYYYFEYLRTRQAFRLVPLFHHNVLDIVTLACLSAVVLPVFAAPGEAPLRHGHDWLGMARWLRRCGQLSQAQGLYARAIEAGLPEERLFAALWESALIEKRQGDFRRMEERLAEVSEVPNPFRARALEELAKHYEHRQKDYRLALQRTLQATSIEPTPGLAHRRRRLERKLARTAASEELALESG